MGDMLIQIVNDHDEPIVSASITEAQEKGLIHRIARVMVEDADGKVLLQKREANRPLYPDRWDNSAAGHVDAGEDYETAAKREMFEEIGLKDVDLKEIGYYQTQGNFEWRKLNRFNKVYKVIVPANTRFVLDPKEVSEVKWFTRDEFKQLVSEHPELITDGVSEVFQRFYL